MKFKNILLVVGVLSPAVCFAPRFTQRSSLSSPVPISQKERITRQQKEAEIDKPFAFISSSDTPFTIIFYSNEPINHKKTYVLGCNVNIADVTVGLFQVVRNRPQLVLELKTATKSITDLAAHFAKVMDYLTLTYGIKIKLACIGAQGNTNANKDYIKFNHISFAIDGREIQAQAGINKVYVVNDFEIVGFGIEAIDQSNIVTLHEGKPRSKGTKVIVGAGNGLGTGLMLWDEKLSNYTPSPITWSFVDFAAHNDLELKLAQYLQQNTGSRSWGKVLGASGGILRIYDYLNTCYSYKTVPVVYKHFQDVFDNRGTDQRCKDAVDVYMTLYARLIRSVAYAQASHSGVYITNSIAENNPELFLHPDFIREVFKTENDYLTNYLSEIPFYLVTKATNLHLYGAALYALVYEQ